MNTYRPGQPPVDPQRLPNWLGLEFSKLKEALERAYPALTWESLHAEPARIVPNMEVLADGADWDPGGIGVAGKYRRNAANTAWELIEATVVAAGLAAHLADTVDAHDASAISNVPAGTIAAVEVQAAINELDGDVNSLSTSTSSGLSTANSRITSLSTSTSSGLSTATSSIVSLSTSTSSTLSTHTSQITSLSSGVSSANSSIVSLSTSTSSGLSTATSSIVSLSTSTSSTLSTHTSQITSLSTGLSTTNSNVTSLSTSTSTGLSTATSSIVSLSTSTSTGLSTATSSITSLSTSTSTAIALKAPIASPSFTGTAAFAGLVDLSGASAGQIKFPATANLSADANTLDDYQEATYTATATGMTTSPTGTFTYTICGNIVILHTVQISGTSNATTFTVTGMPAEARPATNRFFSMRVTDSGTLFLGLAQLDSSGVLTLFKDIAGAAFTNSGTKDIRVWESPYKLA